MNTPIHIEVEKIKNPPEKMRLMYDAVAELMAQKREISSITVSDITSKAGIGKGTAYEYFSSKEELMAHAFMYDYATKIERLSQTAFEPTNFKERCYRVMDWLLENKAYNLMFRQLLMTNYSLELNTSKDKDEAVASCCEPGEFGYEAHQYIYGLIDRFMEDAYNEGAIKETDIGKRSLAFLSAMVEYAFVIMGPSEWRYAHLGDESLREFVYESLVRALNESLTGNDSKGV